jgi:hypothetical protein
MRTFDVQYRYHAVPSRTAACRSQPIVGTAPGAIHF